MRIVPESANRADWPRLVAAAIRQLQALLGPDRNVTTVTFTPSAEPTSPAEGQTYYDATLNKVRTWDGTTWQAHW